MMHARGATPERNDYFTQMRRKEDAEFLAKSQAQARLGLGPIAAETACRLFARLPCLQPASTLFTPSEKTILRPFEIRFANRLIDRTIAS
jgi:hypothetical protein